MDFPKTELELELYIFLQRVVRANKIAENSRSSHFPFNMDPNEEEYYLACKSDYFEKLKEYEQKRTSS